MYRIVNAQGATVFRTDIFSRSQIGRGAMNPAKHGWPGTVDTLDGTVSCSVVIDPDVVRRGFASTPANAQPDLISAEEFWATEFTHGLPVPTQIEDLVIYELHVGSLGFGKATPRRSERRVGLSRLSPRTGRQRGRVAADGRVLRQCFVGLWRQPSLLRRIERGRSRQVPPFRARVSPTRHRRDPGRRLQPLRQRGRACPVAIRLHGSRAEYLLLVRGPAFRLRISGRRLSRQRLERLHAASLGRGRPPAVHQQRRVPRRGNARRWSARGFDAGDPPRQRAPCGRAIRRQRQSVRPEVASGVEPHAPHDSPRHDAHRGRPHRLGCRDQGAGAGRPRFQCHVGSGLLPQSDRRFGYGGRPGSSSQARGIRW